MSYSKGMIPLAKIAGIPIRIHWSFFMIIAIVGLYGYQNGLGISQVGYLLLFVLILFSFVIMHEYGHALAAKKYGILTKDIIITPIGGVARIQGMPQKPMQELHVAIAGPLVNLFFVIVFTVVLIISDTGDFFLRDKEPIEMITDPTGFLFLLALMNGVLFLFNLIPAYPMDGGRILKALLSTRMPKSKATIIAANVGRVLAVAFVIFGAYNRIIGILFIGIFIYVVATRDYHLAKMGKL